MMKKPAQQKHKDDPEQSRIFIKSAKEHGADTDQPLAAELLRQMATKAPKPH
jgi:gamma-glutamyltranspeptidase